MNFVTQLLLSCRPWVATLVTRASSPKSICSHCLPSLVFAHQAPYPLLLRCKFNLALAGACLASALEDAENAASGTWPFSKPRGREQRNTKRKRKTYTKSIGIICCVTSRSQSFSTMFAQGVRRKTTPPFRALYMKPQSREYNIQPSPEGEVNSGLYLALFTGPDPVSRMKKRKSTDFVNKKRQLLSTLFTFSLTVFTDISEFFSIC